ncbi:M48 family metallopeptidase [Bdellovibrio bacteriovorus]
MRKLLSTTFLITFVLVSACTTSPTGRRQLLLLPESQMQEMGAQAFTEMKGKTPTEKDPKLNNYVKCIVDHLSVQIKEGEVPKQWDVVVFKSDEANAFALPGGKVGVYTGLLKVAATQDQLAAVIGHEMGHVIAQHGNARVSETLVAQGGLDIVNTVLAQRQGQNYDLLMAGLGLGAQYGVLMPHGRAQESEADVLGLQLMAKAGFDPRASVELWKNMGKAGGSQPPEFLSTHPSHGTRIENLNDNMKNALALASKSTSKPNCVR